MNRCIACHRRIWPWQKTGANTSWHLYCWISWDKGYDCAFRYYANKVNKPPLIKPKCNIIEIHRNKWLDRI